MILSLVRRFLRWLIKLIGPLTIIRLGLLWLAVSTVALGLQAIVSPLQNIKIFWAGFLGVLFGWLLAHPRLPGWASAPLALTVGSGGLALTIGRLSIPLGTYLSTLNNIVTQFVRHHAVDTQPLSRAWNDLGDACSALLTRLVVWFRVASRGNIILDPLMTAILWGLALWLVAVWMAWMVRRRDAAILGLLPALALFTYAIYSTNSLNAIVSLVFLGGMIVLLQGASGYAEALKRWQSRHLDRAEVESDVAITVCSLTVVLMLAGGLLPSIPVKEIAERIQDYIEIRRNESLEKSLGLQRTPGPSSQGSSGHTISQVAARLQIGAGPELSHEVVMYVSVEGYQPLPSVAQIYGHVQDTGPRYYWRGQTYDFYVGTGWMNYLLNVSDYQPEEPLLPQLAEPLPEEALLVRQHVQFADGKGGTLFVAGQLVTVNHSYSVYWRAPQDLINAQTDSATYIAESRLPNITVKQLREAGTEYPASVQRYLQLPERLPRRVRDLALDLTAAQPTPYDQALAIETYLRDFPYTLDVPAPPSGRDVADFFLFDLQKGYCNYYATTMVVMVRAVGIPARLVTGYASGQYDERSSLFVVTADYAHAWVEVYFPGIGWVEFEPTAGRAAIERPLGSDEVYTPSPLIKPGDPDSSPQAILRRIWLGRIARYAAILGAVILLISFTPVDRWLLSARPANKALRILYRRLYRQSRGWKVTPDASRTPREFAVQVIGRLRTIVKNPRLQADLAADVDRLTDLYTRSLYSSHPLTQPEKRKAIQSWLHLRRRLRWERVKKLLVW